MKNHFNRFIDEFFEVSFSMDAKLDDFVWSKEEKNFEEYVKMRREALGFFEEQKSKLNGLIQSGLIGEEEYVDSEDGTVTSVFTTIALITQNYEKLIENGYKKFGGEWLDEIREN